MITPSVAIEHLIAAGVARVDLHNAQPFRTSKMTLADTVEARSAELISHFMRREQELLAANSAYLERARVAEPGLAMLSNPAVPLTPRAFRSMLATMINIDRHEIEEAGYTPVDKTWLLFQSNPWQAFLQAGDDFRDAIMKVVLARNRVVSLSHEQQKLFSEMAAAWFNEPMRETELKRLSAEKARLRAALLAAAKCMKNCRSAVASNQVVDKDVVGSLAWGIREIDDLLTREQAHGH